MLLKSNISITGSVYISLGRKWINCSFEARDSSRKNNFEFFFGGCCLHEICLNICRNGSVNDSLMPF